MWLLQLALKRIKFFLQKKIMLRLQITIFQDRNKIMTLKPAKYTLYV